MNQDRSGAGSGPQAMRPYNLSVCATFTAELLDPALEFWFRQFGVDPQIEHAGYGQLLQELLNPSGMLANTSNGSSLVCIRIRDWLRELSDCENKSTAEIGSFLENIVDEVCVAFRAYGERTNEETLVLICPSVADDAGDLDALIEILETKLDTALTNVPHVSVVSSVRDHERYAVEPQDIYDAVRDEIAHIPYTPGYLSFLATIAARHFCRRFLPVKKVIVVDCDNTLWKGVVGEDGWDGIEFGAEHIALQAYLTEATERGMLVCLCSKNQEQDVWDVFEHRKDFGLPRSLVVAATVNWQPKSENLVTLANRLNLGLDSFVFIDDNPVECAEVRAGCPEVLTLEWPQVSQRAISLLNHLWDLDTGKTTAEDQRRTEMYRDEYSRQTLKDDTSSFSDFLESLEIDIDVENVTEATLPRASQMTLRTNQFNFTTKRLDEAEVQQLLDSAEYQCRIVRVKDRFGDYGVVGLLITELHEGALLVHSFLLSCRVLGRGVEHEMAKEAGRIASEHGIKRVDMSVVKTQKNLPARKFLSSIALAEHVQTDADELLTCSFAPQYLENLSLDAGSKDDEPKAKAGIDQAASSGTGGEWTRDREDQIKRAAFELASANEIALAIGGTAAPKRRALEQSLDSQDVETIVRTAFSVILGVPVADIVKNDSLEALSCDSFAIVAITVELLEYFPKLPSTLLFEHKTVSGIIAEIRNLSVATDVPAANLAPRGSNLSSGDVAVVGMGLRCAGANSPDSLWSLLSAGHSAVRPVASDREFLLGRLHDEREHWAGQLDNVDKFDAEFFGVNPREAQSMDPQLRLFLEVAWEALEDGGLTGQRHDEETGVFVGVMYGDYVNTANQLAASSGSPYRSWEGFSIANRLSQFMGYSGPSLAIDTACSSSATALHQAYRSVASGESRVALVGGVNLILDPNRFIQLGRLGILSPTGQCRPFDANANGTNLGEGVGVVVLKPLEDAKADGDRIYGVIKGSGVSTGAGTVGFTAPNPQAQAEATRRAIQSAGIDPRTISYVETHGTGTVLGDPIEIRGLSLAYEDRRYWDPSLEIEPRVGVGSIKANIGHLEAGAGVMGLIKVMLQLDRGTLAQSHGFDEPNTKIPFADLPFEVQHETAEWQPLIANRERVSEEIPLRAGLNSFGVGGSNAHFVLEQAPQRVSIEKDRLEEVDRSHHLLLVSSKNEKSAASQLAELSRHLDAGLETNLPDLSYSLSVDRRHLEYRMALVAGSADEVIDSFDQFTRGNKSNLLTGTVGGTTTVPRVAFLFTGQGSQYVDMGRELYDSQPSFRATFDRCCDLFDRHLEHPLRDVIFGVEDAELIGQTRYTQPALFTLQYALATLWRSWGVEPVAVVGHSIGEFAALCCAGGLSLEDAVTLVEARGRLMQALPSGGAMVSLRVEEPIVRAALEPYLDQANIAAVNGPEQIVVSGASEAIDAVVTTLAADGVECTPLTVSHAFHSPLMEPMLDEFEHLADSVTHQSPTIPFLSAVDAEVKHTIDASYWVRQIRSAVRFSDAFSASLELGVDAFIEIGPHPVLLGMGRASAGDASPLWLPSLRRGAESWPLILDSVARLHVQGMPFDWSTFDEGHVRSRVKLPRYSFAGRSYWVEGEFPQADNVGVSALSSGDTQLRHLLQWRRSPLSTPAVSASDDSWLMLGGGEPGRALANELGGKFIANTDAAEAYLSQSGDSVTKLVIASGAAAAAMASENGDSEEICQILSAVQISLAKAPGAKIWLLSCGGASVDMSFQQAVSPSGGALLGFARGLAVEHPDQWAGLVDLDPSVAFDEQIADIKQQLLASCEEDIVAIRAGERFVPRLVEQESRAATSPILRANATYLVTGGTGAIGRHCAEWLIANGARHVVLASRRGANAPGTQELIDALTSENISVTVESLDSSSEDDVKRLVAQCDSEQRRLRGVFHAAGVDELVPLGKLSKETFDRVWDAKARGAWLLHKACEDLELDQFVLFSSMSALIGSPQRAHYAAANAYLDSLAQMRRANGAVGISVAWGPWNDGGMASASDLEGYERIGNRGLNPRSALAELGKAMNDEATCSSVMDIDWRQFRAVLEVRKPFPLLAELGVNDDGASSVAPGSFDIAKLGTLDKGDRTKMLEDVVSSEIADVLGFSSPGEISRSDNFFDLGLDSLLAVQLATQLEDHLGGDVSSLLYKYPTVTELASKLEEGIARSDPQSEPGEDMSHSDSGVLGYSLELESAISQFQREAWPERTNGETRWRWMFLDSAARLNKSPEMWFCKDGEKIVGETGGIPVRVKVGSEEYDASWLVDSMVLEEYRPRAVGAQIVHHATREHPFALSLGQEEYMREIQFKMGWRSLGEVNHYVYPLRSGQLLRGKLPAGPVAWTAASVISAATGVRRVLSKSAGSTTLEISRIERCGAEHDTLWSEVAESIACGVVRDSSYLNWKFVDRPGADFHLLELRASGELVSLAVVAFQDPGEAYQYKRAFLVDLIAPIKDQNTCWGTLDSLRGYCLQEGADAIHSYMKSTDLEPVMRRFGFLQREASKTLLISTEEFEFDIEDPLCGSDNWFCTFSDSDLDEATVRP